MWPAHVVELVRPSCDDLHDFPAVVAPRSQRVVAGCSAHQIVGHALVLPDRLGGWPIVDCAIRRLRRMRTVDVRSHVALGGWYTSWLRSRSSKRWIPRFVHTTTSWRSANQRRRVRVSSLRRAAYR